MAKRLDPSERNAPMRDYAALVALFNGLLGSFIFFRSRKPALPSLSDLFVLGLATQKASRVLARDRVTQPLRQPFVKFEGPGGSGEVEEKARGRGLRKAIGQLVTCPYCLAIWVGSAFVCSFSVRPRLTRLIASMFAVASIADFTQHGYAKVKELTE